MRRGKFTKIKKLTLADFYRAFTSRSANYWISVIALFVVISRWLGHMRHLYSEDSVHFALALDNYDITLHQPHPPGYALYILLTKPIYWLTHDANTALIITGIILSVALVYAIFYLAKEVYGQRIAWISTLLLVSSPMVWFHGQVALTYVSDALFATFFALFAYRSLISKSGSTRELFWASIVLAIGGGFRPTLVILMIPLWLWIVLRQRSWKVLLTQSAVVAGLTVAWIVPAALLSGGWEGFWQATYSLIFAKGSLYTFSVFYTGWMAFKTYAFFMLTNLVTSLGWGGVTAIVLFPIYIVAYYIASPRVGGLAVNARRMAFWLLWIGPALLFYLFVVFVIMGYLLLILPAIIVLTAVAADSILVAVVTVVTRGSKQRVERLLAATLCFTCIAVGLNVYRYYRAGPATAEQPDRSVIRHLDPLWDSITATIRKEFNPQSTVISIERPFVFNGISHFQYYFPEYETYQPVSWGQYNPGGLDWVMAYGRKRRLAKELVLGETASKLIVIRASLDNPRPALDVGLLHQLPLLLNDMPIGKLFYYDLTDLGVKEELSKLKNVKVAGTTTEAAEN